MSFKPKCLNNLESFITATGYYRPCCWRETNDTEFVKDKYDLRIVTLDSAIVESQKWLRTEMDKDICNVDSICKLHCIDNVDVEIVHVRS